MEGIAQAILYFTLVALAFHIDEVDDNQAAEVAQAQLACNFIGSFKIGIKSGLLDIATFGGAAGVDVYRDQCFGMVDDYSAARRQAYFTRECSFDLMLDLKA